MDSKEESKKQDKLEKKKKKKLKKDKVKLKKVEKDIKKQQKKMSQVEKELKRKQKDLDKLLEKKQLILVEQKIYSDTEAINNLKPEIPEVQTISKKSPSTSNATSKAKRPRQAKKVNPDADVIA